MTPLVAISLGCPSGIGPEVSLLAAAKATRKGEAACLLVGDAAVIERAARLAGISPRKLARLDDPREASARGSERSRSIAYFVPPRPPREKALSATDAPYGKPTVAAGRAQLSYIDAALDLVRAGVADALVTGPVSKHAIASSARPGAAGKAARSFRGHTEYLAQSLGAAEVVMAFWSEELTTALVTTHLPLARVARSITPAGVAMATFWLGKLLAELGSKRPRIAVSGVNPHAGEQGLLGDEEVERVEPGMTLARRRFARAKLPVELSGPIGAETAMRHARAGHYDGVVAMYHDQATIPMKLLGFGEAVNVTLGLPIIRTSVDHGTGYDIAGTAKADSRGMEQAIMLAARLARARR